MSDIALKEISLTQVCNMLYDGLIMSFSKECRLFTIIPILINMVILFAGSYFIYHLINDAIIAMVGYLPDFLSFLASLLSYVLALIIIASGFYFFSTFATIIASPFYGLLAERVESIEKGLPITSSSFYDLIKDVPRIFLREIQKLAYYVPRLLLCLIVMLIPVVNLISPILWILLASWMISIQFCDYAYDNHKTSFAFMKQDLKANRLSTFIFGFIISFCITIPIFNLFVPAGAVCAGTKYYIAIQKNKGAL